VTRTAALALLALGAGLAWVGSAQAWWRASGGTGQVAFTGNQVSTGLTQGLALVAAAGVLLVLVLRTLGRRVLGVLLTLAGMGMIVAGAGRFRPDDEAVLTRLREVGLVDRVTLTATAWPGLYVLAGVLVVAGGVGMLVGAQRWSSGTDRFARSARSGTPRASAASDDPLLAWRALDAGVDPTLPDGPGVPSTPDVQSAPAGDTMGETSDKKNFLNPTERRTS
jgi:uncharacterized membrane protein (TIGR02234 family)